MYVGVETVRGGGEGSVDVMNWSRRPISMSPGLDGLKHGRLNIIQKKIMELVSKETIL